MVPVFGSPPVLCLDRLVDPSAFLFHGLDVRCVAIFGGNQYLTYSYAYVHISNEIVDFVVQFITQQGKGRPRRYAY